MLQSINYVDDVINKEILEMLSGSISIILEILIDVDSIISNYSKDKSVELKTSHKLLLESLSDLMKWADSKLLLEDPLVSFDKKEGREHVEKLKDAAKEFLRITVDSLKSSKDGKLTTTTEESAPKTASIILEKSKASSVNSSSPQPGNVHPLLSSIHMNANLSYSADDILDDKPPPKPPIPQQLLLPSWNFLNGFSTDGDIVRNKKSLPPALPVKSRGGSLLSDSHSDGQSNASADANRLQSNESVHRSPTNSVNSILSASSEEFLLEDAPPPKPPRSPDRRFVIGHSPTDGSCPSISLSSGSAEISYRASSVVQKTVVSSFTSKSVQAIGDGRNRQQSVTKELTASSFSSSCTRSFNNNKLSSSSSSFLSSIQESLSTGKLSSSSSVSSNQVISLSPVDGAKNFEGERCDDNDPNVPPPLPPKQKPVETYMSIFGSSTPVSRPNDTVFSDEVVLRRNQFYQSICSPSIEFFQDKYFRLHLDLYAPHNLNASPRHRGSGTTVSSHSSGLFSSETGSSTNDGDSTPPSLPPKTGSYQLCIDITPSSPQVTEDSPTPDYSNYPPSLEKETSESQAYKALEKDDGILADHQSVLDLTSAKEYLVFKKSEEEGPEVRAGSVDALIVHATVSADFMFQEAFLMTYRTFLSPQELLRKLIHRYDNFGRMQDNRKKYSRNAFSLIVRVLDDICIDTDCDVLETMSELSYHLIKNMELKQAQKLRERCVAKLKMRQQRIRSARTPLSSYQVTSKCHSVLDFKSHQIAEQMTLLDFELFQKIDISEILLWSRQQKEELSPNLTKFTEHFNRMSYWCRTQILEREETKEREKYLVKFIKIMKHLRQLNNFHSYLAILSALDSAPIRRLDWQKNNVEALKDFCQLIDSSSSFRAYRQTLAETRPPCIPYIGLILQDLTFIHVGNPDLDYEGRINFNKCWQLFAVIDTMCRFKRSTKYNIKKNDKILSFFNNFDGHLTEDSLWQISEIIKPRHKKQSKSK